VEREPTQFSLEYQNLIGAYLHCNPKVRLSVYAASEHQLLLVSSTLSLRNTLQGTSELEKNLLDGRKYMLVVAGPGGVDLSCSGIAGHL